MKASLTLVLILSVTLFSCGTKNTQKITVENKTIVEKHTTDTEKIITANESDTVKIPINNGYGKITLSKKERQSAYISFDSGSYKHLHGTITPKDSNANIRFNQIAMPDGSMDGPFGRDIDYDLSQKGIYKITLSESLMAGDPWGGVFTVELKLSN